MVRTALVFLIGFTIVVYTSKPVMDRKSWLQVVGLTVVATLVSTLLDMVWP